LKEPTRATAEASESVGGTTDVLDRIVSGVQESVALIDALSKHCRLS